MSKNKKRNINKDNIYSSVKNKISISFIFFILIFFIIFLITLFGDKYFNAINSNLLTLSYIVIFFFISILLHNELNDYKISAMILNILKAGVVISITIIYIKAFYPYLEMNGDNAGYIIKAKAFLEGHGFRNMFQPNTSYDTALYNVGFSFLLMPFILIGKMNFIILKLLPLFSTIGIFILLYYILKQYISKNLSLIIVLLTAINEEILHFSSLILTENVFICFLLLSIFLLIKYENTNNVINKFLFFSSFSLFFAFLIRFAGLAFLSIVPFYFLYKKNYKKAIALFLLILLFFCVFTGIKIAVKNKYYNIEKVELEKSSPSSDNLLRYVIHRIIKNKLIFLNAKNSVFVIPQKVLDYSYKAKYDKNIIYNIILFILLILGVLYDFKKKLTPMSFFVISFIATIIIAFNITDLIVMSRYYIPLIPFVYFYIILGLSCLINYIGKRLNTSKLQYILFGVILSLFIIGAKTANIDIYINKQGLSIPYMNYLEIAKWSKTNIPKGEIVGVRKSTIFYLFSNHQATPYYYLGNKFNRYSSFSKEMEILSLKKFKTLPIHYFVFDTFSGDSFGKLLPIMKNYPERFKTIHAYAGRKQIIKLSDRWWMNNNIINQIRQYGAVILLKYSIK